MKDIKRRVAAMSSYIEIKITCKCCGHKFSANELIGYTVLEMDLDTYPHNPCVYDQVIMCPNCGYADIDTEHDVSEAIKEMVRSDSFKKIYLSNHDSTYVKLSAAEYIAEKSSNYRDASYYSLLKLWYLRDKNADLSDIQLKVISLFEKYLTDNVDKDAAIIYIDVLRQTGRFEEALETVCSLEPFVADNEKLRTIVSFEKELIINKDIGRHGINEVNA